MTASQNPPQRRALHLDVEKYQTYLDDSQLPEDQKRDMIKAIWRVIIAFCDFGYDLNSLEGDNLENCGKVGDDVSVTATFAVESEGTHRQSGGSHDG